MITRDQLSSRLKSDDLLTRVKACSEAARQNQVELNFLAILREHVSRSDQRGTHDVCVAVRSIGEITRKLLDRKKLLTSDFRNHVEFLLSELGESREAYSSSIIFALCLIGPSARSTEVFDAVLSAVGRDSSCEKLRFRAFQFACAVHEPLLKTFPWSSFIPPTPELREKWGRIELR